jgi:hypothetical protein
LVAVFIDRNQKVVSEYMDKSVILCSRPEFVVVSPIYFYIYISICIYMSICMFVYEYIYAHIYTYFRQICHPLCST